MGYAAGTMKAKCTAFLLAGLAVAAAAEDEAPLAQMRARYEQQLRELDRAGEKALVEAPGRYLLYLDNLRKRYVDQGELNGVLAVQNETNRFAAAGTVTTNDLVPGPEALLAAQKAFVDGSVAAALLRKRKQDELAREYVAALERLKVQLTKRERIDEAVAIEAELERMRPLTPIPLATPEPAQAPAVSPPAAREDRGTTGGVFAFGGRDCDPVVGDWDGDGKDGIGVFHRSSAQWELRNLPTAGTPDAGRFEYGGPNWIPLVGDWNGDGKDGIGVLNPATGAWALRNTPTKGPPDAGRFKYGGGHGVPLVGDWDGDGRAGIGVFNPALGEWLLRGTPTDGKPNAGRFAFGGAGCIPLVGDWDGDGIDGIGVFDASTGEWRLRNTATSGEPDAGRFRYGGTNYLPVVGDWDGDGKDGIGVFDPSNGEWRLRR
jgi:hypothetical protein